MVQSIISELNDDLFDEYMYASKEEVDMLKLQKLKEPTDAIIELIGDYNTLKLLLIREENTLEEQTLKTENDMFKHQQKLMEKGMKITEAKQQSKVDLEPDLLRLIKVQKDIALLKASIHSIEYQLRLQFKRMSNGACKNTWRKK